MKNRFAFILLIFVLILISGCITDIQPSDGFGLGSEGQQPGYWWCSDSKHLTNGEKIIECRGVCRTVDGRDRCIEPDIPPSGAPCEYQCIESDWIEIACGGVSDTYYCKGGCELTPDSTTMCWCADDPDCANPDGYPPADIGNGGLGYEGTGGYWWCSDYKHMTNGKTTIECVGYCKNVNGRDRCIEPDIPPGGNPCEYNCIGADWISVSCFGKTEIYYCKGGCELTPDGTTMCWCADDPDCANPEKSLGGVGKDPSGTWYCEDEWHFTNGVTTVFCEGGCIDNICYEPQIPESMPPCCYECTGPNDMTATCNGESSSYYCAGGCEDRGDCIDICWCGSDAGCLEPTLGIIVGTMSMVDTMGQ